MGLNSLGPAFQEGAALGYTLQGVGVALYHVLIFHDLSVKKPQQAGPVLNESLMLWELEVMYKTKNNNNST